MLIAKCRFGEEAAQLIGALSLYGKLTYKSLVDDAVFHFSSNLKKQQEEDHVDPEAPAAELSSERMEQIRQKIEDVASKMIQERYLTRVQPLDLETPSPNPDQAGIKKGMDFSSGPGNGSATKLSGRFQHALSLHLPLRSSADGKDCTTPDHSQDQKEN